MKSYRRQTSKAIGVGGYLVKSDGCMKGIETVTVHGDIEKVTSGGCTGDILEMDLCDTDGCRGWALYATASTKEICREMYVDMDVSRESRLGGAII